MNIWILILMISNGSSATSVEFNSFEACSSAQQKVAAEHIPGNTSAICVKK